MRFKFLFLLLFLKSALIHSQNEYQKSVDSLYVLIDKEENDAFKIDHYKALCDIYSEYDLKEFRKCNAVFFGVIKSTNAAQGYGFYYCNQSKLSAYTNLKEAVVLAEKGKALFYKIKDWNNYVYACSLIGNHLNANNQIDEGIQLLTETLPLAIKEDSDYLANLYYVLSKLYRSKGDNATTIYYAKKALTCKKPLKKKYLIYHGLANIYIRTGNYDKALEYNELDMKFAKSSESKYSAMYRRGDILIALDRPKEALPLLMDCLKYYEDQKSTIDIIDTQHMISSIFYKIGNYKKANYYIDEVLKIPTSINEEKIRNYSLKAKTSLALNDIANSKLFIDNALNLLDDNSSFGSKTTAYSTKIALEKRLGNYKTALYYQEKITALNEINYTKNNKNKVYQLEVDLGITEKNNRIKNLQITQLQKQAIIITKNKYLIYIFCALLVSFFGLFFFLYMLNIIKIKNIIIGSTNLKLAEESNKIQKSLQEKETLLKEIHHRVKNNLQLVMSLLNIQAQKTNQSVAGFLAVSKSRILSMALIHENLYQSENLNEVNFKDYVQNLTQTILNAYDNTITNIDLQIEIEEMYFDIQTAIPLGLIINELVNNAYKHAFVNKPTGIITLKLHQKEDRFELLIGDNGTGIPKKVNARKTLGLQLVEELVFQIDGQLKIENNNGMQYVIVFQNSKLP